MEYRRYWDPEVAIHFSRTKWEKQEKDIAAVSYLFAMLKVRI